MVELSQLVELLEEEFSPRKALENKITVLIHSASIDVLDCTNKLLKSIPFEGKDPLQKQKYVIDFFTAKGKNSVFFERVRYFPEEKAFVALSSKTVSASLYNKGEGNCVLLSFDVSFLDLQTPLALSDQREQVLKRCDSRATTHTTHYLFRMLRENSNRALVSPLTKELHCFDEDTQRYGKPIKISLEEQEKFSKGLPNELSGILNAEEIPSFGLEVNPYKTEATKFEIEQDLSFIKIDTNLLTRRPPVEVSGYNIPILSLSKIHPVLYFRKQTDRVLLVGNIYKDLPRKFQSSNVNLFIEPILADSGNWFYNLHDFVRDFRPSIVLDTENILTPRNLIELPKGQLILKDLSIRGEGSSSLIDFLSIENQIVGIKVDAYSPTLYLKGGSEMIATEYFKNPKRVYWAIEQVIKGIFKNTFGGQYNSIINHSREGNLVVSPKGDSVKDICKDSSCPLKTLIDLTESKGQNEVCRFILREHIKAVCLLEKDEVYKGGFRP